MNAMERGFVSVGQMIQTYRKNGNGKAILAAYYQILNV